MDSFRMPLISLSVTATLRAAKKPRISSRSKSRSSGSSVVIRPVYWNAVKYDGGTPRERNTNRRAGLARISSQSVCAVSCSCKSWKSSIKRTSQFFGSVRSVKSGASAHSRSVRCPRSSALASAVLPKPQGALKKRMRPLCITLSNFCCTDGFIRIFPVNFNSFWVKDGGNAII